MIKLPGLLGGAVEQLADGGLDAVQVAFREAHRVEFPGGAEFFQRVRHQGNLLLRRTRQPEIQE
ncbi:hypothetical protein O1L60_04110 [Streptomyces diastatochromogenes]|nr:hypothetical protein [Streptomyces diastatochromogenes]